MLYLLSNQTNSIVVTWTERYSSDADYVILELTNTATRDTLSFALLKSANLSAYQERYDRFEINVPETEKGKYTYTVFESTTTSKLQSVGVVETGLALVEMSEVDAVSFDNQTNYVSFGSTPATPIIATTPVITPSAGTYAGFLEVTLTSANGGTIYYTTDGSVPTAQNGIVYDPMSKPIITSSCLFQARVYADGFRFSGVAATSYVIIPVEVFAIPEGGEYLRGTLDPIALGSNSESALIYYTLNGDDPTEESTLFTTPIERDVNTTLKFRGFDAPAAPSEIVTEQYDIKALAPTLDTASGTFISQKLVTATNTNPLGQNEYSIDGGSYVTGDSVLVEETANVTFRTAFEGYVTSDEVTINVEIQCAAPTISPDGGVFEDSQEVTITTNEPDGVTYYTTDGSEPTESSTLYSVPFTITATTDVKAKTFRSGTTPSETESETFTLAIQVWYTATTRVSRTIQRTEDRGDTWVGIAALNGSVGTNSNTSQIRGDDTGQKLLFGISNSDQNPEQRRGIWRSVDSGATAVKATTTPSVNEGNGFLYASTNLQHSLAIGVAFDANEINVFVSNDEGQTYSGVVINGFTTAKSWVLALVSASGQRMFVSGGSNTEGAYMSNDYGATWTKVLNITSALDEIRTGAISDDGLEIVIRQGNNILKSTDGGNTFSALPAPPFVPSFLIGNRDLTVLYITQTGTSAPIAISTDGGLTWANLPNRPSGFAIRDIRCSKSGGAILFCHAFGVYRSLDFGDSWTAVRSGTTQDYNNLFVI